MDKISIIVPVYNVEKYIVKCINSLIQQTYSNIEILVVNDGSTDNSINLIKQNFNDERIQIFNKKNEGVASARNFALKKASGNYLFFVDSDDFIDSNTLNHMYETLKKDKSNLVICDYYKYYDDNHKQHIKNIPFFDIDTQKTSIICMPGATCKLFKKDFFDKYNINFLEGHCFEDNAIIPFVCAVSGKFSYLQQPYYYYLQRNGSYLNKNFYDKKWEDIFDSLQNLYEMFQKNDIIKMFFDELEYIYIEYLLHAANLKFIKFPEAYHNIQQVSQTLKEKFPDWRKNKYYKKENIKYKIICNLFYYKKIYIARKLLKIKKGRCSQ